MKHFSLLKNDGRIPDAPTGDVLVFGKHKDAFAYCDYDGNMDRPYPNANPDECSRWVVIAPDFDSIMAWHGERRKDKNIEYGKVTWKNSKVKEDDK